jgi:hypothetical protein
MMLVGLEFLMNHVQIAWGLVPRCTHSSPRHPCRIGSVRVECEIAAAESLAPTTVDREAFDFDIIYMFHNVSEETAARFCSDKAA